MMSAMEKAGALHDTNIELLHGPERHVGDTSQYSTADCTPCKKQLSKEFQARCHKHCACKMHDLFFNDRRQITEPTNI